MSRYITKQLTYEPSYRGLHIHSQLGPLITSYLDSELRLIEYALSQWKKVYAFRFDLHFPVSDYGWPPETISKFIASFESKIKAIAKRIGYAAYDVKPKFIWAKEQKTSHNPHYHLVVLMDENFVSGSDLCKMNCWQLKKIIEDAWASALELPYAVVKGLAVFADNGSYIIDLDSSDFLQELTELFFRISYFAKLSTKAYGDGTRHFTTSRVPVDFQGIGLDILVNNHKQNYWDMDSTEVLCSSFTPSQKIISVRNCSRY